MSESPFQAFGLKAVINASGKMTALGGTAQTESVASALRDAAQHHVELDALKAAASERIAERTGAEAACVTTGAASGIAIGVAALICRDDRSLVHQVPNPSTSRREIVLFDSHNINFGAQVEQMIRIGGGVPKLVSTIGAELGPTTAGVLFVQSHHVRDPGPQLEEVIAIAHQAGIPVMVDAAAEESLTRYTSAGADLVTYSGGKAIGGPTVGFVTGRADLVAACELQYAGLARAMKVGKEQIAALLTALDEYDAIDHSPKLDALYAGLADLDGIAVSIEQDLAGRSIRRVGLRAEPQTLVDLVAHLRDGDPAIHSRNHQMGEGLILFDVREITLDDIATIVARVRSFQPS